MAAATTRKSRNVTNISCRLLRLQQVSLFSSNWSVVVVDVVLSRIPLLRLRIYFLFFLTLDIHSGEGIDNSIITRNTVGIGPGGDADGDMVTVSGALDSLAAAVGATADDAKRIKEMADAANRPTFRSSGDGAIYARIVRAMFTDVAAVREVARDVVALYPPDEQPPDFR